MAIHSSVLSWRIPWIKEAGRLSSPWGLKELDVTEWLTLSLSLSMILPVGLSYMVFTMLRHIPSMPNVLSVFIMKECWLLSNAHSAYTEWSESCSVHPTPCDLMAYTAHGIFQARILKRVAFPFSRDLPNPEIKPRFPALQADSLTVEPSGKPTFIEMII